MAAQIGHAKYASWKIEGQPPAYGIPVRERAYSACEGGTIRVFNFSIKVDGRAAAGLSQQIELCSELQISNLEIDDDVGGQPIVELTGAELERYRSLLIEHHKKIVLLNGSKPAIDYDYYKKLLTKALQLQAEHIKIPAIGQEADEESETEALCRLVQAAKAYGIGLVVENDSSTTLSDDRGVTAFYGRMKDGNTGIVFNPLEFVRRKAHPFFHVYYSSKLKGDIRFLRVNDGLFADGRPVLPGQGNAEVKELASILLKRSYRGYFSFTPYMEEKTDEAGYRSMLDSFKKMLKEL
jgi:sugar phosphate isomerase/epimerase